MRTITPIRRSSDGTIIPNKINEESIIKTIRIESDYGNDKVSTPCFKLYYFSFFSFLFILIGLIEMIENCSQKWLISSSYPRTAL
jgi:hypothetical protein